MHNYNISVLQLELSPDAQDNEKKALDWVTKAAKEDAQVICLPELYRSQYFCQKEDTKLYGLAETIPGPSTKLFSEAAARLNVVIIVPLFEKRGPGLYHNSVVIVNNDGTTAGMYRKMHIPDDPAYYEKYYFTPGDLGFNAIDTAHGKIATLICWDQWFPEGARIMALQGAPVLFYPTAIGWHPAEIERYGERQQDAWVTVQRGHAVANGMYVAAANRIGLEQPIAGEAGIQFWGSSFIADPQGVILARASNDKEEILLAEVDLKHLENVRHNWPFLRDRRIDAYQNILKRYID